MNSLPVIAFALLIAAASHAADLTARNAFATVENVKRSPASIFAQPHAAVNGDRIITAHQDSQGRPLVMAYDTTSRKWSEPVRVSARPFVKGPAGNPAVCADRNDITHLFFSSQGKRIHHMKSLRPGGFEKWKLATSPPSTGTMPQVFCMADGSLRLFYRSHDGRWVVTTSDDDGDSWKKVNALTAPDQNDSIFCLFVRGKEATSIHALLLKSENKGQSFHSAHYLKWGADDRWRAGDDTALKPPFSPGNKPGRTLLLSSDAAPLHSPRMVISEAGDAYVCLRADKTMYGATYAGGKLNVSPVFPDSWPLPVRRALVTPGVSVPSGTLPARWYTTASHQNPGKPPLSRIWLGHLDDGLQQRNGGPAPEPPEDSGDQGPTAGLF